MRLYNKKKRTIIKVKANNTFNLPPLLLTRLKEV
jgi:hypothetical protein